MYSYSSYPHANNFGQDHSFNNGLIQSQLQMQNLIPMANLEGSSGLSAESLAAMLAQQQFMQFQSQLTSHLVNQQQLQILQQQQQQQQQLQLAQQQAIAAQIQSQLLIASQMPRLSRSSSFSNPTLAHTNTAANFHQQQHQQQQQPQLYHQSQSHSQFHQQRSAPATPMKFNENKKVSKSSNEFPVMDNKFSSESKFSVSSSSAVASSVRSPRRLAAELNDSVVSLDELNERLAELESAEIDHLRLNESLNQSLDVSFDVGSVLASVLNSPAVNEISPVKHQNSKFRDSKQVYSNDENRPPNKNSAFSTPTLDNAERPRLSVHAVPFFAPTSNHVQGMLEKPMNQRARSDSTQQQSAQLSVRPPLGRSISDHRTQSIINITAVSHSSSTPASSPPSSPRSFASSSVSRLAPADSQLPGDSPNSKGKFKNFYKDFWQTVKSNVNHAHDYATRAFEAVENHRFAWKIALEIADLAKRNSKFDRARQWLGKVNSIEPRAASGWLEHAKLEEEQGNLVACEELLKNGMKFCDFNENLLIRAMKFYEKIGKLPAAEEILLKAQLQPMEKNFRTVLEGALIIGRAGFVSKTRSLLAILMKNCFWFGPIFIETAKFEEKNLDFAAAKQVLDRGLQALPRYGPLWFASIEYLSRHGGSIAEIESIYCRALLSLSSELHWKLRFEAAQALVAMKHLDAAQREFECALQASPANLRWKIFLSRARAALKADIPDIDQARKFLAAAAAEVPKKMALTVALEEIRLEEFAGRVDVARRLLVESKEKFPTEWKIFFEAILVELRAGDRIRAIRECESALISHRSTGRLWAIRIQLLEGEPLKQLEIFQSATQAVPKSGEVYVEGAKIFMNPTTPTIFNPQLAQRFLHLAVHFTPQFGDSFIELVRWNLLANGFLSEEFGAAKGQRNREKLSIAQLCANAEPNYGSAFFKAKSTEFDRWVALRDIIQLQPIAKHAMKSPLPDHIQVVMAAEEQINREIQQFRELFGNAIRTRSQSAPVWAPKLIFNPNQTMLAPLTEFPPMPPSIFSPKLNPALCDQWNSASCSSIGSLYRPISGLATQEKHRILFASEPIAC